MTIWKSILGGAGARPIFCFGCPNGAPVRFMEETLGELYIYIYKPTLWDDVGKQYMGEKMGYWETISDICAENVDKPSNSGILQTWFEGDAPLNPNSNQSQMCFACFASVLCISLYSPHALEDPFSLINFTLKLSEIATYRKIYLSVVLTKPYDLRPNKLLGSFQCQSSTSLSLILSPYD